MVDDLQVGLLTYEWLSDRGSLEYDARRYAVVKHGPFSNRWTLENEAGVEIEAQKSSFFREFVLRTNSGTITVKAQSPFGRGFVFRSADQMVGVIRPIHLFTRRAVVDCDASVPETVQVFAFWLVGLLWQRAQSA
jgi:hypothetical protein